MPERDNPAGSGPAPIRATDRDPRVTAHRAPPTKAIVDGSNVAFSTEGERPRLRNIILVRDKLREEGMEPILVVDAALRHKIDDAAGLERLVDAGEIKQAPAGTDADHFILMFARELDAAIVSNDRFKDRIAAFPEAEDDMIRYMIVADEVVFERRANRKRR